MPRSIVYWHCTVESTYELYFTAAWVPSQRFYLIGLGTGWEPEFISSSDDSNLRKRGQLLSGSSDFQTLLQISHLEGLLTHRLLGAVHSLIQ